MESALRAALFIWFLLMTWELSDLLREIAPLEIVGGILFVPLAAICSWLIGIIIWKFIQM